VPLRLISVRRGAGYADAGTILLDESVFRRQKLDSLTAMSIAESVARIWLGGSTPISGDGGGAIREGLVRFVATEFLESKFGREIADIERLRQRTAYVAVSKRDAPMSQITPLDDYYYVTNANKGAMIWRLLARKVGTDAFFGVLKANMRTGGLSLSGLRGAFGQHKEVIDYSFDQVTDLDLMIGLPQSAGGETKMALRNTGSLDVQVDVTATNEKGERSRNTVTIPARGFTETVFRSVSKFVRVEVDGDKLYPQIDYANDVKPAAIDESDAVLFIKRQFDRQDYPAAERNARIVIAEFPRFDDARLLLARSLLAQGKIPEAEREFRGAMDEKLPSARTLAWGNVGLGEVALKNGQAVQAIPFFDAAVRVGADAGAAFAARQGRVKANVAPVIDEAVKAYFAAFDKAAISGSKAALDTLIVAGDTPKAFGGGIVGQAQEWASRVVHVDVIDAQNLIVEANLSIRVINKSAESGTAVFRLTKLASGWKLSGIESFEVR
jgi:tetratricopeptide (TPR) repeat protein